MRYDRMTEAIFLSRPNRFIAHVLIEGREEICHVKNTGRCAELLIPGARIWVHESDDIRRKTRFDLITVDRGGVLVNMDSQAPNRLFAEWAEAGGMGAVEELRAERRYKESRFDFALKRGGKPMLVEVKGVTLERGGVALFPDAPTERGLKHINELTDAAENGYIAAAVFIIQMKCPTSFSPNMETQPEFGRALLRARDRGVELIALDCAVTPDSVRVDSPVPIALPEP